jgi:hypothetical protein
MRCVLIKFGLATQLNKVFSWDGGEVVWEEVSDGVVFEVSFI